MIYQVSFGSIFWSVEPDKIWTFLDVLFDKGIPFVSRGNFCSGCMLKYIVQIMSHASPFAKVPDWITAKAKATGLGLLSPWSPQQTILIHPVSDIETRSSHPQ